ncbi:MAG: SDR family oxidoreductase [Ruminococcus sp.]
MEEFERVIKVNLTGAFISSRAAGKAMIKQKSGSIILTASMSGHIVNIPQCQCAYNSSKAGVILLGKSLAIEWAKHGIRVNTVSPGYIRTWSDEPLKPEEVGQSNFEQWTPLKRFGAASEIAGIIVYLASEESSFVTGSDFVVDGGYTAF